MIQNLNPLPHRVTKESKEQLRALRNNFALGSSVLVAGTASTALWSDSKQTAQIICDVVNSSCKDLSATKFLPKVKETLTNITSAFKTMWKELPGKATKLFVASTALAIGAVAVKTVADAIKVHKNNNA